MAVFTFSTRQTKPTDTQLVKRVKEHCDKKGLNFSKLVIQLLAKWEAENVEPK
jgi:hypothetical protein